jgi:hypothetical protein
MFHQQLREFVAQHNSNVNTQLCLESFSSGFEGISCVDRSRNNESGVDPVLSVRFADLVKRMQVVDLAVV